MTRMSPTRIIQSHPSQTSRSRLVLTLLSALFAVGLVLAPSRTASAGGIFRMETPVVSEAKRDKPGVDQADEDFDPAGTWHIRIYIELPKAPGMITVPMRLIFSKEVVYQRNFYKQGEAPKEEPQTLDTAAANVFPIDPGFGDVEGNIFNRTKYETDLRRDAGYFEAGEYTVKLEGPNGVIGNPVKLKLKGVNKKDYRGAMDFSKGNVKDVKSDVAKNGAPKTAQADDNSAPGGSEVAPVGNGEPMIGANAGNALDEEKVQGRPKGCGCTVPGESSHTGVYGLSAGSILALGLVAARRRRRPGSTRAA
jgi:MYXO-CTERM domain-containing protein